MNTSKFLVESGWKDVTKENNVKDNGLLKALAQLKRADEDKHDEVLRTLDDIAKLATQAKKAKEVVAVQAAAKYLGEMLDAVDAQRRGIEKAKAEHEKEQKAKAAAAKKKDDDEDDDDEESPELLTTKLKPLLKLVARGETMHALVAKSGKKVVVMLSRKPIPPARRKILAEELGGGSTKYYPGTCCLEAGATTFALKAEVAGMAKLIKLALLEQTGLRVNKVKCRGDDGDDDDGGR